MSEEKIKVVIRARETVSYHKIIEIPIKDFEDYQAACDRGVDENWFSQWADQFLDPLTDISGGCEYEDVECEIFKETGT